MLFFISLAVMVGIGHCRDETQGNVSINFNTYSIIFFFSFFKKRKLYKIK